MQPIQMGMVRHVMVDMGDERDNIDVRLTIPMRTATRVELIIRQWWQWSKSIHVRCCVEHAIRWLL